MPETKDKLQKVIDSFIKTSEKIIRQGKVISKASKPKPGEFKYHPKQTG